DRLGIGGAGLHPGRRGHFSAVTWPQSAQSSRRSLKVSAVSASSAVNPSHPCQTWAGLSRIAPGPNDPSMPPIKRTKFRLSHEQLSEMFYWLKLIRGFDERLSTLVKQGKVRSGVYTGIGQEAIIVGTCFGLRKEDFICPLHRDLGSFLMKGVSPRTM